MSIELKMPALSPTMEKGTLAKWLVRVGDVIKSGDQIAEIETDKATMEFEAADDGRIMRILVPEGTDDVAVGTVIALLGDDSEQPAPADEPAPRANEEAAAAVPEPQDVSGPTEAASTEPVAPTLAAPRARLSDKVRISPLAARIARAKDIDVSAISGTGPGGRIVRADLGFKPLGTALEVSLGAPTATVAAPIIEPIADVPHTLVKLSGMRKTIARRLTQSKQQVPHIYLSLDIRVEALLMLRTQLNESLASRGTKVSVNDLMIKAQALALVEVPAP
jgi:pyruvate dehydrogenase E2 component (dihydrolipoamide acetyltransferase)